MFSLYELAGVATNLLAGMAGATWGLRTTHVSGLAVQFLGIAMLCGWQDSWSKPTAILYVTLAQMLNGIAKDLVKLGGKAVTKLVTPEDKQGTLFSLVSYVTGFKNSMKGVGYLVGAAVVSAWPEQGYLYALFLNLFLMLICLPPALFSLNGDLGTAKSKSVTLQQVLFNGNANLNWLSLALLFLFCARDLWFEVALPFYLRSPPCPSVHVSCAGAAAACPEGTFCGFRNETRRIGGGLRYYDEPFAHTHTYARARAHTHTHTHTGITTSPRARRRGYRARRVK